MFKVLNSSSSSESSKGSLSTSFSALLFNDAASELALTVLGVKAIVELSS